MDTVSHTGRVGLSWGQCSISSSNGNSRTTSTQARGTRMQSGGDCAVLEVKELRHHPNVQILEIGRVCSPVYFMTNKVAFNALVGQMCMEAYFSHRKKYINNNNKCKGNCDILYDIFFLRK